jgi:hypothetical protein
MPTEIIVKRVKAAAGSKVKVSMSFEFDAADPTAADVYRGIGLLLREVLTPNEALEFLNKLNAARRNPRGGEIRGRVKG